MRSKTFRESYQEDMKIFQTVWVKFWLVLFIVCLLSVPLWADPYIVYMANISGIAIIAAMGLNILTGLTGQISLGHAAFVAIGAYSSAILATKLAMPFWLTIPFGGVVAAFFGTLLGFPCLRLKGLYLAMATMSFGVVVEYTVTHWESLTMGVRGISVPPPTIFGSTLCRPVSTILCDDLLCGRTDDVCKKHRQNESRSSVCGDPRSGRGSRGYRCEFDKIQSYGLRRSRVLRRSGRGLIFLLHGISAP